MNEETQKQKLEQLQCDLQQKLNAVTQELNELQKRSRISEIIQSLSQRLEDPKQRLKNERKKLIRETSQIHSYGSSFDNLRNRNGVKYTPLHPNNFIDTQREYEGYQHNLF